MSQHNLHLPWNKLLPFMWEGKIKLAFLGSAEQTRERKLKPGAGCWVAPCWKARSGTASFAKGARKPQNRARAGGVFVYAALGCATDKHLWNWKDICALSARPSVSPHKE